MIGEDFEWGMEVIDCWFFSLPRGRLPPPLPSTSLDHYDLYLVNVADLGLTSPNTLNYHEGEVLTSLIFHTNLGSQARPSVP